MLVMGFFNKQRNKNIPVYYAQRVKTLSPAHEIAVTYDDMREHLVTDMQQVVHAGDGAVDQYPGDYGHRVSGLAG